MIERNHKHSKTLSLRDIYLTNICQVFHFVCSFLNPPLLILNRKLEKIPAFNIWCFVTAPLNRLKNVFKKKQKNKQTWRQKLGWSSKQRNIQALGAGELPDAAGLMPKGTAEWMEPRSIHRFLGLCTIKGTTGVVCYVSKHILNAVHSHGPQFQTGPDLFSKVSPSESESYADFNSWFRIKVQLLIKDKHHLLNTKCCFLGGFVLY